MLNGIAPIFIFTIPPTPKLEASVAGIPVLSDLIGAVGVPIPVYLDENLTGVYVSSEEKAIDIDNDVSPINAGNAKVFQRPLDSIVTINLLAKKDSTALIVLLAMCDLVFSKLKYGYGITYLNGPTTLFGGLLKTFSTHTTTDDDLIRIVVQLSKAKSTQTSSAFNAAQGTTTLGAQGGSVSSAVSGGVGGAPVLVPPPAPVPAPVVPIPGQG